MKNEHNQHIWWQIELHDFSNLIFMLIQREKYSNSE